MKQHDANLDNRIHAFISGRTARPLSEVAADWINNKLGGQRSEFQTGEPIVGMKYEAASRGKI